MIPVLAPGQDHPFGEERRLQVRGQHRAAVEQALGQPVLTGPIAGGLPKAEICDMLTTDLTPASAAACAKITVASRRPDPARREPTPVIHLATWSLDPDLRPELTALIGVPQGFGLGSCCQLVPFHFSMKEMCLVYWSPSPIAQA